MGHEVKQFTRMRTIFYSMSTIDVNEFGGLIYKILFQLLCVSGC